MNLNLLVKFLLVLLGFSYIGLQAFQYEVAASGVCTLMLILLTILYRKLSKIKKKQFYLFLLLFTLAEILGFVYWFMPVEWVMKIDWPYYIANSLYIAA